MSEDNYRMAYTMISVTIVPAASISTFLFQKVSINNTVSMTSLILPLCLSIMFFKPHLFLFKLIQIGPAKSCVMANMVTGFIIIALIFIASASPTNATYAGFLSVLYFGSPFTFIRYDVILWQQHHDKYYIHSCSNIFQIYFMIAIQ